MSIIKGVKHFSNHLHSILKDLWVSNTMCLATYWVICQNPPNCLMKNHRPPLTPQKESKTASVNLVPLSHLNIYEKGQQFQKRSTIWKRLKKSKKGKQLDFQNKRTTISKMVIRIKKGQFRKSH